LPARIGLGRCPFAREHGLRNASCRRGGRNSPRCREDRLETPSFFSRPYGRGAHKQVRSSRPFLLLLWLWLLLPACPGCVLWLRACRVGVLRVRAEQQARAGGTFAWGLGDGAAARDRIGS